jgi:hypothetical protein
MSKDKISDYSSTANSNTDIAGINIDEGCAPSGINDAIRTLMAQLKNFQQGTGGDSFNGPFAGTTIAATDTTDASSTTAAAMKTAGGLAVAKKAYIGLDANIYGLTVGRGAGSVSTNTAVGASALAANTTGDYITAVGTEALGANTSGVRNTAVGRRSLYINTTGGYNSALGMGALYANSTGSYNTAVGQDALTSNTTASNSTAVGYQALYSNTASNNAAVGYQALYANTTGTANVSFGYALPANTTGSENSAVGWSALVSNTTGSSNTAIGRQSLASNTTASNNTAVGYQAGYGSVGAGNTFVGMQTGYSINSGSATYNVMVGQQAGYSVTTGTSNTLVGVSAGYYITSGGKNTVVGQYNGNQGGLDIRTSSNNIVLSDGDGNPRLWGNSEGRIIFGELINLGSGYVNITHSTAANNALVIRTSSTTYSTGSVVFQNSSGGNTGYIQINGSNSTQYVTSSDYRLKQNVQPMTGALAVVEQLNPVTYDWKDGGGSSQGFIAHELQALVPECVSGEKDAVDENGKPVYQGIDTSFLVATLTAAIQELKAEFDAYKEAHP